MANVTWAGQTVKTFASCKILIIFKHNAKSCYNCGQIMEYWEHNKSCRKCQTKCSIVWPVHYRTTLLPNRYLIVLYTLGLFDAASTLLWFTSFQTLNRVSKYWRMFLCHMLVILNFMFARLIECTFRYGRSNQLLLKHTDTNAFCHVRFTTSSPTCSICWPSVEIKNSITIFEQVQLLIVNDIHFM